ncbi:hypothetical protein C4D60_Mb03t06070 [Musa balbisiana]|uniref:Uncharacterized protein n=1 Tax=Musa balbisiana TaxID=52838 RepID=A0A4S8J7Z8_MUSBA|nr:hypothetical protein C4D60_Mb03t06070 [Musa balbisiana]
MAFNLLSCWVWPGKGHEAPNATPGSSSDSRMGFREPDYLQFAAERQIDREYDVVLVPSDGGCVSCCQSDESDWSIGWLEPHAPEFQTERETENSFAVLVPCYGNGRYEQVDSSKKHVLGAVDLLDEDYSAIQESLETSTEARLVLNPSMHSVLRSIHHRCHFLECSCCLVYEVTIGDVILLHALL